MQLASIPSNRPVKQTGGVAIADPHNLPPNSSLGNCLCAKDLVGRPSRPSTHLLGYVMALGVS